MILYRKLLFGKRKQLLFFQLRQRGLSYEAIGTELGLSRTGVFGRGVSGAGQPESASRQASQGGKQAAHGNVLPAQLQSGAESR